MGGGRRKYHCSWDQPNERVCNYHKIEKGIVALARKVVVPSISGWTLNDNFQTIASSVGGRDHFARQCMELIEEYDFDGESSSSWL